MADLSSLPAGFYSHKKDFGHPGPLASRLIAESVYKWYKTQFPAEFNRHYIPAEDQANRVNPVGKHIIETWF